MLFLICFWYENVVLIGNFLLFYRGDYDGGEIRYFFCIWVELVVGVLGEDVLRGMFFLVLREKRELRVGLLGLGLG